LRLIIQKNTYQVKSLDNGRWIVTEINTAHRSDILHFYYSKNNNETNAILTVIIVFHTLNNMKARLCSYFLFLQMMYFCCSAERFYFVKYGKNATTQLFNIYTPVCYVWTVTSGYLLDSCLKNTCPLESKAKTVPAGLRKVDVIIVEIKVRMTRCATHRYPCHDDRLGVSIVAYDSDGTTRGDHLKVYVWTGTINLINSHQVEIITPIATSITKGLNITNVKIRIEPYKFCGNISEILVYTPACLPAVVHDLVMYPYSAFEKRVNGSCVPNAVRKSPDSLLNAVCDFKLGYTQFTSDGCECKSGFKEINGTCVGEWNCTYQMRI